MSAPICVRDVEQVVRRAVSESRLAQHRPCGDQAKIEELPQVREASVARVLPGWTLREHARAPARGSRPPPVAIAGLARRGMPYEVGEFSAG